ncbi:MAG: hypothetical protein AAGA48_17795 [Myxococcota bacterium]
MTETPTPATGRHLSTLVLHQLRLGELDSAAAAAAQAHVDACPLCADRLRRQHHIRASFVLKPMPEVLQRPPRPVAPWWRWLVPLGVAVAALGLLALRPPADDGIRMRGTAPSMEVWVATEAGPRQLREDDRLGAGDRVAIKYDALGASHVGFAGRDGNGLVEVYGVYEVPAEGLVNAPFGLELDSAPGAQELFVVTGDGQLDADRVKEAVVSDVSVHVDGVQVRRAVISKQEAADR